MVRKILAALLGLVSWVLIVSALDRLLRVAWPDYAAAIPTFGFSLSMKIARLGEGAVTTLMAGYVAGRLAPRSTWPSIVQGAVLLMAFIPVHYGIWDKFPIWYHLTFLGSLFPLTWLGAVFGRGLMQKRG